MLPRKPVDKAKVRAETKEAPWQNTEAVVMGELPKPVPPEAIALRVVALPDGSVWTQPV